MGDLRSMNARHLALLVAAMAAFAGTLAQAQTAAPWPSKPIRWIVPFPPGGPADVVTRMLSAKLAERVGQPGIVENRAGAGGNVGHEAAAKAAPDGHTVVFVVPAIVTNPVLLQASIDPFRGASGARRDDPGFRARRLARGDGACRDAGRGRDAAEPRNPGGAGRARYPPAIRRRRPRNHGRDARRVRGDPEARSSEVRKDSHAGGNQPGVARLRTG